jgi:hypothetical protein
VAARIVGVVAQRFRLKLKRLDFISAVDAGAQGPIADVALIKRHDESGIEATFQVAKVDSSLGLVFGWALATSLDGGATPHVDLQSDAIDEADLIKVAAEFMEDAAKSDVMHDFENDGRIVFAMPLVPEVNKALGIETKTHGLAIAMKPSPATFKRFQSGELKAFSIAGVGERVPMADAEKRATDEKHAPATIDTRAVAASLAPKSPPLNPARKVEPKMTEEQLKAKIAELEAELASLKEKSAKDDDEAEKRFVVLTTDQHAHYAKLHGRDAIAFVSKSDAERTAIVKAALDADPVVYTTKTGLEIRKSQGALMKQLAEDNDANVVELEKARVASQTAILKARAKETLGHLAGTTEGHIELLKAVDGIADEKLRNEAITALKTADAIMASKGIARGSNGSDDPRTGAPAEVFNNLVEAHMKAANVTKGAATEAVLNTAEGKTAYAALRKSIVNR